MRYAFHRIWRRLALFVFLAMGLAAATAPAQATTGKWKKDIAFEFHNAKWTQVIEWFADQANLDICTKSFPKGIFNFTPSKGADGKPVK